MKRLLVLALVGSMTVFTMTACGGSDSSAEKTTTEATEAPAEDEAEDTTEDTAEDTAEDTTEEDTSDDFSLTDLESEMTEAYAGQADSGEYVYYAGNEDGSFGILVYYDEETAQNASFVGTVTDAGDNMLTITDDSTGNSMTFGVSATEEGDGIVMDMGEELGTATLGVVEVSEVLEAMQSIAENTTAADATTSDASDDFSLTDLESAMTEAYAGQSESGEYVYYAGNEDGSLGILLYYDEESGQNASFVGTVTDASDTQLTITDDASGASMTFGVTATDDGQGIVMDMGEELGTATLGVCEVSEVLDAMQSISENTEAVN